jgi:protein YIPF1/2
MSKDLLSFPSDLEQDPTEDLAFQDIRHASSPTPSIRNEDKTRLLPGNPAAEHDPTPPPQGSPGYLSLAYYQQWFDVDNVIIGKRVLKSILPPLKAFYEDGEKPDLYGPFWITTTLIVVIASASNLANYFASSEQTWQSDFTKVSFAASMLYSWLLIVPMIVWFMLKRIGCEKPLANIISYYGYSFTVFSPSAVGIFFDDEFYIDV